MTAVHGQGGGVPACAIGSQITGAHSGVSVWATILEK